MCRTLRCRRPRAASCAAMTAGLGGSPHPSLAASAAVTSAAGKSAMCVTAAQQHPAWSGAPAHSAALHVHR